MKLEILTQKQDLLSKRYKLLEPKKLPLLPPLVNLKKKSVLKREN